MSQRHERNLTVRQIDVGGVTACMILTALAYVGVVRPVASERAALATLRGEVAAEERKENAIQTAQRRIESELALVRGELEASPVRLEAVAKLNQRLARIEKTAEESGLLIHKTSSSEAVSGNRYDTVPIEVSGSGTYPDCARFLHRLKQDLPEVEVLGFELSASPGEPRARPAFRFDLAWYAAPAVASAP